MGSNKIGQSAHTKMEIDVQFEDKTIIFTGLPTENKLSKFCQAI